MIELTEEQQIVRDSVARYLRENYPFSQRQADVGSPSGFDRDQWQVFAELGWLGMPLPEAYGGYGGSWVEAAVICEQFGRALYRSPYIPGVVGAGAVVLSAGDASQKKLCLPGIADGTLQVSCAFNEKTQFRRQQNEEPSLAEPAGEDYRLHGVKGLVPYAAIADYFIVSAVLADKLCLFLVSAQSDGIRVTDYRMYDGGRAGDVEFSDVTVGRNCLLQGDAADTIRTAADKECAMLCVEAVGIMWSVQEQTLEYMKTRQQFGQALGTFQALQHRIVDVYVSCQLAESMAWDAVDAVINDDDPQSRSRRVSAAKSYIGEIGRTVGKEGIQLHGGVGMTNDLPIGHYLKRLTTIDHLHGNAAEHRDRFRHLDMQRSGGA